MTDSAKYSGTLATRWTSARLSEGFTLRSLGLIVVAAAAYFAAAKAALLLAIPPGYATAVWPPSGIAVALLLIYGIRVLPGIWLGALASNWTVSSSLVLPSAIATGNSLEAICAVWLLRRILGTEERFERPEQVFGFALAVAFSGAVAASVGVTALYISGSAQPTDLLANWYTWWQGDTTSMIVITPLLLAWLRPKPVNYSSANMMEVAGFMLLLLIAFVAVFALDGQTRPDISRSLAFLLIPFIAWAGCRFSEHIVTAIILSVAGIAIWASVHGIGPFAFASTNESLLILQAFVSTMALMGLALCALNRKRAQSARLLQDVNSQLERTVTMRTRQLAQQNAQLLADLEDKERMAVMLRSREAQLAEAQALTHTGSWSWNVKSNRVNWSDELYRIYGIPPSQFAGTTEDYLARVHPADREAVMEAIHTALSTHQAWELTERILRPDGAVRLLQTVGRVTVNDAGEVTELHGACHDVTESRQLELIQTLQHEVTKVLAQAPSRELAIAESMRILGETLGWPLGQMWRVDPEAEVMRHEAAWFADSIDAEAFISESRKCTFELDRGLPGRTWAAGRPIWIEDLQLETDFARAGVAERAGLHCAFALPLTAGEKVLGVLEFFGATAQKPQDELLQMGRTLGNQLGEFLVRSESALRLRESEDRFRLLVEGVKDYAIIMLDSTGRIATWNEGAKRINGYTSTEIIGSHFSRFYTAEDRAQHQPQRIIAEAAAHGRVESEGWRIRKDGSRFWAHLVITALHDAHGKLTGFAKVTRDLTEQKRVEELEQADQHTRQFLAMLGHELRNPLAPIRTAVAVMQRLDIEDSKLRQCTEMIDRQVTQLSRLVDDLLDASRITSGLIELRKEILDLSEVARLAVEASRPDIQARRHTLDVELPLEPVQVAADPARLAQVIQNLLNNAAKYTPPEGIIRLSLAEEEAQAILVVRDNGVGIPPDLLPKVFDLFTQAAPALARSEGGLGLGLAIVRQIVEMHGGTIEADSAGPGQGAVFRVSLPLSRASAGSTVPVHPRQEAASQTVSRTILITDDNRDAADSMAALLEIHGHRVCVAYDGPSALAHAMEHAPEVLLLDIGLPGMNGYQLSRQLRTLPQTRGSLLIAVTGYGQAEDRQLSTAAGFDDHLVKPVDVEALVRILARPHDRGHD